MTGFYSEGNGAFYDEDTPTHKLPNDAVFVPDFIDIGIICAMIRAQRNALISDTDYMLMSDYQIDIDTLELVKKYRQELRDITEQQGFSIGRVDWPKLTI